MVERKLYKTKLCVLYQRGRCHRPTCSFAHGDAELRRFSGSFNGRRDYRSSDLRDKLDRRNSPIRRHSPGRDTRGRHGSYGFSPSRTFEKKSEKRGERNKQLDGQSDFSGSLRHSEGADDQIRNKKTTSSDSEYILGDQLRQLLSEIAVLNDQKGQLKLCLEESVQEADSLNSRIQELEMQLVKEKEECKRITSKIKKFVKAHNRHMRLQDELKRSQARLQKIGDQFGSDATRFGANEEDSNINILSDEETPGTHVFGPQNELPKNANASPSRKRTRVHLEAGNIAKQVEREGLLKKTRKLGMRSRWNEPHTHIDYNRGAEVQGDGNNGHRHLLAEDNLEREKNILLANKSKGYDSGLVLPSTGMAAHAIEEIVEVVELDDKNEAVEYEQVEKGAAAYEIPVLPILPPPPPPPVTQNPYSRYKGRDHKVDVEGLDGEMADVDIV